MKRRNNLCLDCGACCAFFRASFFYREADDFTPEGVPLEMTEELTQWYRVMKGTNQVPPRCIALEGEIGKGVFCTIHPRRSTVCREFPASYEDGINPNERCDKARAVAGLPPLRPEDWETDDDLHDPDNNFPLRPAA